MTPGLANAQDRLVKEVDLSGYWEPLNMEDFETSYLGPGIADYTGIPLNDDAREHALSYSFDQASMVERACMYYPSSYLVIGPFGFRITAKTDDQTGNVVAWRISPWIDRQEMLIWMDGRSHPGSNAMHTFAGFTTGAWKSQTLTAYTTHLKAGPLRRNGVTTSDSASITMHFTRHEDYLKITAVIVDPITLTEPYVLSRLFRLNTKAYLKNDMTFPCVPSVQSTVQRGSVPNFLPGKNAQATVFADRYGLPMEAALGGAQTMYPEYQPTLNRLYKRPVEACSHGICCGWGDTRNPDNFNQYKVLGCPGVLRKNQEVFDLETDNASGK